ncbi:MAG TPA: nitrilase-related carbon-nitrogen hydrolase [Gammaproteobacteria bacterium]|jgi:predicted amidohydrolase|nr:nitrilase [Chromatiales bacterium]MCP4925250.1 nitrilase [Gammaproteobacteria bacterium]MDP7153602.1 nitrilase-related carbon-nitrogen hydrolase [Gammaproteobacteria bacterium]MDP7297180.1 nitrilase-related carbon-nitrogen hydrolase [Gammaproteobacteria bacterium]MDP7660824.1 nitrilase-related carbon-nitrogen hydrolase [Gammaproteobacteria bacterium]
MKREKVDTYTALVVQPEVTVIEDRAGIRKNLDRVCNLIHFGVGYHWEVPVRLVVLPEYFMQGVGTPGKGESGIKDQMKKAVTIPGPEIDQLAAIAKEYQLYICGGGVVEEVPEFPGRWFNTNFIVGPSGEVVLKYHKWHIPAYIGLGTSPHDMFDEYKEVFGGGIGDLFPVIDTEIGKLGTMTCHDGCTPEVSRALGYNGAEIICHPGAIQEFEGVSQPWDFWMFTRRTRAHDNMVYLLGSNWGTVNYDYYPKAFCPGHSYAIDYTGLVLREAPYPAEQVLAVSIDIEALRQYRTRAGHNCWIDMRTEGFQEIYANPIYPANRFPSGNPPRTLAEKVSICKEVFDELHRRGTFTPPAGYGPEDISKLLQERIDYAQQTGRLRKS